MSARTAPVDACADLATPSVPVAYPRLLMQVVSGRGFDAAELLRAARLRAEVLEEPEGLISAMSYALMIMRAISLTDDACLGCEMGLRMSPTMHGPLGWGSLSSSTLRDALNVCAPYFRLASPFVEATVSFHDERVRLTLDELSSLGAVRQFVMESALIGVHRGAQLLLGQPDLLADVALRFSWPRPAAFDRYAARLPATHFDAPANQLDYAASYLDYPLMLADSLAAKRAVAQCEQDWGRLDPAGASCRSLVLAMLTWPKDGGSYAAVEEVARRLQMSLRTLARRLESEGTSYRQLMDERRCMDAKLLLAQSDAQIEAIATRLGYVEPANFTRAFRKWTGETPSAFRRSTRATA
jgi:AraC-like DNA-binding protein